MNALAYIRFRLILQYNLRFFNPRLSPLTFIDVCHLGRQLYMSFGAIGTSP